MKLNRLISFFISFALPSLLMSGAYTFMEHSPLASGKWVKVEIDETGLYSIPYSTLLEMGFEDPSKVGVYGKGGIMMTLNFPTTASETSASGYPYTDRLQQVSAMHSGSALLFWGQGTENVSFLPGTVSNGNNPYFENHQRNIYSRTAYYFLSDSEEPLNPEIMKIPDNAGNPRTLSQGWGFICHERDLHQNSTDTGNLFWGESFLSDSPTMKWTVTAPNLGKGTAHLSYQVISGPGDSFTLRTSCTGSRDKLFPVVNSSSNYFFPLKGRLAADPYKYAQPDTLRFITRPGSDMEVSIAAEGVSADYLNLDFWLLSYPKDIIGNPLHDNIGADLYYLKSNSSTSCAFPLDEGLCAWSLADPEHPQFLPDLRSEGEDSRNVAVWFGSSTSTIPVLFFDPARKQREILSWKPVQNNDIHGSQGKGIEFLIVTVPSLRPYAERIADLHRKHDEMEVLVVTVEELYNEFSAGIPDPMAYRAAVTMLHQGGLKNLLLLGPSMKNMLIDAPGGTPFDHHIAMQHSYVKPDESSMPIYEFYGVTTDSPNEASLHSVRKNVGVGLLSCESATDCERIIAKIERYLTDDNQAWIINETLSIGGLGNEHLHDQQAVDTGELILKTGGEGMAHNTLVIDAYGNLGASRKLKEFFDHGKFWNVYFGHGASWMFGTDPKFFTSGDAVRLTNRYPGIFFMGGCDFTSPDSRVRGIGEGLVLDCDHGMIATICSTRTAWSSQNKYLGDILIQEWLHPASAPVSPTLGEIFARAKSSCNALNQMSFILAGDPALRIPSPTQSVAMTIEGSGAPREIITVKGAIMSGEDVDKEFNGKIALKLMEPAVTLRSRDYVTDTCNKLVTDDDGRTYYPVIDVPYESTMISAMEGYVENGEFEIRLTLPEAMADFAGEVLRIKGGAYDPYRHIGAAGAASLTAAAASATPVENIDNDPPAINFEYIPHRNLVAIEILDDTALSLDAASYTAVVGNSAIGIIPEEYAPAGANSGSFRGYIDVSSLPAGEMQLRLTAPDIAGNVSEETFSFIKTDTDAPLHLSLDSKAVVEKLSGRIEGEIDSALNVVIAGMNGDIVTEFTAQGDIFEWNLLDSDGVKATPGHYRVCVRSASGPFPIYSPWTEFGILQ